LVYTKDIYRTTGPENMGFLAPNPDPQLIFENSQKPPLSPSWEASPVILSLGSSLPQHIIYQFKGLDE
jgi:hypothetical protein